MRGSRLASLTLAWYGMLCCLPCTCSFPVLHTRMLTDALNIKYPCLPNHALRWQRVTEAAPPSKEIRVFY